MKAVFYAVSAVVAGLLVLLVLVIGVELFSALVHPMPADFAGTTEQISKHVARYPQWVLAIVLPMWAATAFASTWTAGMIGNRYSAVVVGLLLVAALVCNLTMLPYPMWFKVACLIAVPAAALIGIRTSRRVTKMIADPH